MEPIRVSALVVRDPAGRVLTVRKRGTERFMLVGGKPEPGETPAETAARECAEEVGLRVDAGVLVALGRHDAAAANEPGQRVEAHVFAHPDPVTAVAPAGEIAELRWLDPGAPLPDDLAPLLEHHVLPLLG
ncbi:NUDIX domain-containing protein [Nocardioides sp. SYSU D00038]|uniref:NUDIX hydrolase n=1 Tax=Nocardioides sp. SYSU D00038 TaxID=2812554 RepID=UPI0027DC568D|nr:NUDIX domain-containing protein [Nocardioides sp. SYSU D00038]